MLGKLRLQAEKNWPADERRYPQIRKHLLAESRENTENFRLGLRLVRVDLNSLTESVIGSAFEVSNTLGAGFLEKVYERALVNELGLRGITAATQTTYPVAYKGHVIAEFQPDMVVENILIVELKCVDRFGPTHLAQCLSYLQASGLTLALLLNFQHSKVQCRRVVREF